MTDILMVKGKVALLLLHLIHRPKTLRNKQTLLTVSKNIKFYNF